MEIFFFFPSPSEFQIRRKKRKKGHKLFLVNLGMKVFFGNQFVLFVREAAKTVAPPRGGRRGGTQLKIPFQWS